jgi:hypothetical protein
MVVETIDTAPFRAATAEIASSQKNVDQAMLEKIRAAGN